MSDRPTDKTISIGDTVLWRGSFGLDNAAPAQVVAMELTDQPRQKYGIDRPTVTYQQVRENRVVFALSNGRWCYSDQIQLDLN